MPRKIPNIRIRTRNTMDGGRVFLDYYVDGHRRKETIGPNTAAMRRLAKQVALQRQVEILEGRFQLQCDDPRFADFREEFLSIHAAKRRSAGWMKGCLSKFAQQFGNRRLSQITTRDVEWYQAKRGKEVKPATVNRELAMLKSLYSRAIAWGQATHNPVRGVRFLKENNVRVRYLTSDEGRRLEAACSPMLAAIVVLARHTGMRRGEILSLRWSDVDFATGFIRVQDSKNGEGRDVPMNRTVQELLKRHPQRFGSPFVFSGPNGQPLRGDRTYQLFKRACREAGIADFRFHDLRHDCASQLVMAGVDLQTVREVLGHKSLAMTMRYAHLSPGHKLHAVRVLDQLETDAETPPVVQRGGSDASH